MTDQSEIHQQRLLPWHSAMFNFFVCCVMIATQLALLRASHAQRSNPTAFNTSEKNNSNQKIRNYFVELEHEGLLDVEGGSRKTLIEDLRRGEALLRSGAFHQAAVAFFSIVESPRYRGYENFIEFHNSQYYLAAALKRAKAYDTALHYLIQTMEAGPSSLYFGPAHRLAIDIGLETRRHTETLKRLESIDIGDTPSPTIASERSYLRARSAYEDGDFKKAETEIAKISYQSRLYSSALYLLGVIQAQKKEFASAAENFCEISSMSDNVQSALLVDDRYFRVKDVARLGLARIAHETGHYDNAYYHYFQIPEDSEKLGNALFEAAWSMYQKRELSAARTLTDDFLTQFPNSPQGSEAKLLTGYIELADCKFDDAQNHYEQLIVELTPLLAKLDAARRDPKQRATLLGEAHRRHRSGKLTTTTDKQQSSREKILGLLRSNDKFFQAHEAVLGLRQASGDAPHVSTTWHRLSKHISRGKPRTLLPESDVDEALSENAMDVVHDLRRLQDQVKNAQNQLRNAERQRSITPEQSRAESIHLKLLADDIRALQERALATADATSQQEQQETSDGIKRLILADLRQSKELETDANQLLGRLEATADRLAQEAIDQTYEDVRRILSKAKLGKIDAVIGQKRRLEIKVQDFAAGRFPAELHGQLWEHGWLGDDEEFWPYEGEYWDDEYEGWR